MTKNYYDLLGVSKGASEAEIKKAYKKLAMQYHPDRNRGDKKAEAKFKEINEAYQTLSDKQKKKNYDQFGSGENPFSGMGGGNSYHSGYQNSGTGFDFGDIFSQFGGGSRSKGGFEFDLGDIFSGMSGAGNKTRGSKYQKTASDEEANERVHLDVSETVEIAFLDFLYDTSIDIRTVYGKHLSLKIKAGTLPGTKFKLSGKGRMSGGRTGDMYVTVNAKMPKLPLDTHAEKMINALRNLL